MSAEPSTDKPAKISTMNPAHAILAGAILSACVGLIGVLLNIRSSERISSERDKRDAAVSEASALKDKVAELEKQLADVAAKIPPSSLPVDTELDASSPTTPVTVSPTPSIVVQVALPSTAPPNPPATVAESVPVSTKAPGTTKATPSSEVPTSEAAAVTTTTSTTITTTTTTSPPATTTTTSLPATTSTIKP